MTIPMDTLIPRDAVVNTWCVNMLTDDETSRNTWQAALATFYDSVSGLYPGAVAQNGLTHRMYRMTDPKPRPPIQEYVWNFLSNPTGAELPHELAICVSFQGTRLAGATQARRRGRVYLGPLDTTALNLSQVSPTMLTTLKNAASALLTTSMASSAWKWCVWSETNQNPVIVNDGWIDDGCDIQRRRGVAAVTRTVFP